MPLEPGDDITIAHPRFQPAETWTLRAALNDLKASGAALPHEQGEAIRRVVGGWPLPVVPVRRQGFIYLVEERAASDLMAALQACRDERCSVWLRARDDFQKIVAVPPNVTLDRRDIRFATLLDRAGFHQATCELPEEQSDFLDRVRNVFLDYPLTVQRWTE
jgi:hypothetical protein